MKKEEYQKVNTAFKNEYFTRSRSQSPKAYHGCITCRLKNVKSGPKLSDSVREPCKQKKTVFYGSEKESKNEGVKLIDLCNEDKKRIVELIEELTQLAETNQNLKNKIVQIQEEKQQQQDYMMQQASLFMQEKNFYVNEINKYKIQLEKLESETRNKIFQYQSQEKCKNNEIAYLTKNLQKVFKEKNELHEHMSRLKICLKQSLESFQRLRAEVAELQRQGAVIRTFNSTSCQTENQKSFNEENSEDDEEFLSTINQDSVDAKSSLNIINNKLEYVYQLLLKRKKEHSQNISPKKYDIDLSIMLKNKNSAHDKKVEELARFNSENEEKPPDPQAGDNTESEQNDKCSKPFEQCSKTLIQAERILQKIGHPLNSPGESQNQENNLKKISSALEINSSKNLTEYEPAKYTNILHNNIFQKNREDDQNDEDQLLEELFYSDYNFNLRLDSNLKLEITDLKQNCTDRPFTW